MPVVESEFLLALRADDRKHKVAVALFDKYPTLEVCSAAFLEVAWLLRSKGKTPTEVSLALSLLNSELESRNVAEIPVTASQIGRAHDIMTRHSMTFFDALVLANVEESQDGRLISSDNTFDSTGTVRRIPLR
jgi:predicted nucleic acid-binding protein